MLLFNSSVSISDKGTSQKRLKPQRDLLCPSDLTVMQILFLLAAIASDKNLGNYPPLFLYGGKTTVLPGK